MKSYKVDKLTVEIYENRTLMGEAAARDIKAKIAELLKEKAEINMIFAAAPSQNDVLQSLVEDKEIEWNRVNAYHMDEYRKGSSVYLLERSLQYMLLHRFCIYTVSPH